MPITQKVTQQDILAAFQFRHACKVFDEEKLITDANMNCILEVARLSPSSFGFEPWHFIVLQDKKLRAGLKHIAWGAPAKLDTASHFVLGLTMKKPMTAYDSEYIKAFMEQVQKLPENVVMGKGKFYETFQKSDFDLLQDARNIFDWASKQCYIPLANMMTTAALLGIDSCPIEGFQQDQTEVYLRDQLGVDTQKYGISYMVAFGYRKDEQPTKTRRPLTEIVTWR